MATIHQINDAGQEVRNFFRDTQVAVFPTNNGISVAVRDRTLEAPTFRALDRITKKYGCTYSVAPAVSKGTTGFVLQVHNAS